MAFEPVGLIPFSEVGVSDMPFQIIRLQVESYMYKILYFDFVIAKQLYGSELLGQQVISMRVFIHLIRVDGICLGSF